MKYLFVLFVMFIQLIFTQEAVKHDVYFETDLFDIPETEERRLFVFLSELKTEHIKQISIYGYCDDRGSNSYNLDLSQKRANAIKFFFYKHNINSNLITHVDGKGEVLLNIISETDIGKIRGFNRKVEILVNLKPSKIQQNPENTNLTTTEILKGNLKKGDKILLDNLLFRTGYSYLVNDSKPVLDSIAEVLAARTEIHFKIEGHVCCTSGERDAIDRKNKKRNLSFARAKYIYEYLLKKGVNRNRMSYVGLRRKFPLGGDPELDRRVELLVTRVETQN